MKEETVEMKWEYAYIIDDGKEQSTHERVLLQGNDYPQQAAPTTASR